MYRTPYCFSICTSLAWAAARSSAVTPGISWRSRYSGTLPPPERRMGWLGRRGLGWHQISIVTGITLRCGNQARVATQPTWPEHDHGLSVPVVGTLGRGGAHRGGEIMGLALGAGQGADRLFHPGDEAVVILSLGRHERVAEGHGGRPRMGHPAKPG